MEVKDRPVLVEEMKTLLAESEKVDLSTEDGRKRLTEIDTRTDEIKTILLTLKASDDAAKAIATRREWLNASAESFLPPGDVQEKNPSTKTVTAPARARRGIRIDAFKNTDGTPDYETAFRFGKFCQATLFRNQSAQAWCKANGLELFGVQGDAEVKVAVENVNTTGGFLVPEEFDDQLIDLREQYGVFRPHARLRTMRTDTRRVPRRTGGLTAYFLTDDQAITDSTKNWDAITLIAKKIAVLAKYSNELNEDAVIDIGNDLAKEIAYAFSKLEDQCGFIGDGSSTYGGITGISAALTGLSSTLANVAGLITPGTATSTSYSTLALADFDNVNAALPQYADNDRTAWYCHRTFYHGVMERLMLAAGGVTAAEVAAGRRAPVFMGYPVHLTQVMPSVCATVQVPCLFGDLSLAADFGDRRMTTIALSEHAGFANDELQIRGTERFDIVVHDVGNASATASARVPGPMVGLLTSTS